jgi:hypothetical protein
VARAARQGTQPFLHPDIFFIAFGGIFMAAGTGAGSFIVRDDLLLGLLLGGIFTLVGGVIFAIGVRHLLQEIH